MNSKYTRKVLAKPLLLAMLTLLGLVSALLGTGYWHVLAWLALIIPLATIIYRIIIGNWPIK